MSTRKKGNLPQNSQVRWIDLEPWLQQLQEQYGVYVTCTIHLEGLASGLQPAVRVEGNCFPSPGKREEKFTDYRLFRLESIGEVERHVLAIVSQALLVLDNESWRAEQQMSLFSDK